jgi:F0F1-type ATP synthase membrane subunit b/b'
MPDTSKIRRILNHEVTQLISIVVVVYSFIAFVILPIKSLEKDLENVKTNHLHTIEMNIAEIKTLFDTNTKENNEFHAKIAEELTRTATILDQHIRNNP